MKYGDEICLKHEDSQLWLSALDRCSYFDKACFGVEITEKLTNKIIF